MLCWYAACLDSVSFALSYVGKWAMVSEVVRPSDMDVASARSCRRARRRSDSSSVRLTALLARAWASGLNEDRFARSVAILISCSSGIRWLSRSEACSLNASM